MWVAFSRCEFFAASLVGIVDDPVNREARTSLLSFRHPVTLSLSLSFYLYLTTTLSPLKSHLCASYERPSSAYSTFVYLYGSSIETSISRRCLPFTNNSKVRPFVNRSNLASAFSSLLLDSSFPFIPFLVPSLSGLWNAARRVYREIRKSENGTSAPA